jgi:hypothetical protein
LAPDLSIRYNSTAKNGYLGVGWSIAGLSQITRCNKNRRYDSWPGAVKMDSSDRYCLDGRRMLEVDPNTYGQDGAEYFLEPDNFSKIVSQGQSGDGPESFTVWTRDGRILTYGKTLQARHRDLLNDTVRSWYLSRIQDRAGNIIDFTYKRHDPLGRCSISVPFVTVPLNCEDSEIAPDRILYGGFEQAGLTLPHTREVVFHYSAAGVRRDVLQGYLPGGGGVQRTRLLDRIETRVRGEPVRAYEMTYNYSPDDPAFLRDASLLMELAECTGEGTDKRCKAPTTFDYKESGGVGGTVHTGFQVASLKGEHVVPPAWTILDLNGDGLVMYSWAALTKSSWRTQPRRTALRGTLSNQEPGPYVPCQ